MGLKLRSLISFCILFAAVLASITIGGSAAADVPFQQSTTSISFTVTTTTNYPVTTGGVLQVTFDSIQLTTPPPVGYSFGVVAKTFPGFWITRVHWEFGDGSFLDIPYCCQSQISEVRYHAYTQGGSYTVLVIAFDNAGNFGNAIVTVNWTMPLTVSQALFTGVDNGQGSVSPNCPTPNGCQQQIGSQVSVTATPSSGWQFLSWSTQSGISCGSNNPCTFNMPNNQVTLRASFIQILFQTLITGVASGSGSVGPNCPTGCSTAVGSSVSVSATPSSGWSFSSWTISGASCSGGSSSNPCTFSMPNNPVSVYATFTFPPTQTLFTDVDSSQGSVFPNCPASNGCQQPVGSQVTITTSPAAGWSFSAWSISGASCSGGPSSNPCVFPMPNNQVTIKATFNRQGVPGFPLESIVFGIMFGLVAIAALRRRMGMTLVHHA